MSIQGRQYVLAQVIIFKLWLLFSSPNQTYHGPYHWAVDVLIRTNKEMRNLVDLLLQYRNYVTITHLHQSDVKAHTRRIIIKL